MTTPPRVSAEQAAQLCRDIVDRHLRAGDDEIESHEHTPADLLLYLRRHGHRVPDGVRADDLFDAATLQVRLWWEHQERELWLLGASAKAGLHHGEVAAAFGMGTGQGFRDRLDRLTALLGETGTGRPDEQFARAARAEDAAAQAAGGSGEADQRWLAGARNHIAQLGLRTLRFWRDVDEETAESMSELRRDLDDGVINAQTFVWLVDAVDALAACEEPKVRDRVVEVEQIRAGVTQLQQARAAAAAVP